MAILLMVINDYFIVAIGGQSISGYITTIGGCYIISYY